jgi:hypothetical protein
VEAGANELRFRAAVAVEPPVAWLEGPFLVIASNGSRPGPNGTLALDGPFTLRRHAPVGAGDLVPGGCPFGSAWELALPDRLSAGTHAIELDLVPSTLNFFGPHHHVDGDPHVVSPAQYAGSKNFADRPYAPACTGVDAWHVKPALPPSAIAFLA